MNQHHIVNIYLKSLYLNRSGIGLIFTKNEKEKNYIRNKK
jgi:hypothetical protein